MYIQLQLPVNRQVSFCLGSTCSNLFGITSAFAAALLICVCLNFTARAMVMALRQVRICWRYSEVVAAHLPVVGAAGERHYVDALVPS
jgi:hypothetical protein